jgi:hypothetical protein
MTTFRQDNSCRVMWTDYTALIRTRLVDLGPANNQNIPGSYFFVILANLFISHVVGYFQSIRKSR